MKDKLVSEELRRLATTRTSIDKPTIVFTASQVTKDAQNEEQFSMAKISGGVSKSFTADLIFSFYASEAMRDKGEAQIQFLKTRNSGANGKRLLMSYNADSLMVCDHELYKDSENPFMTRAHAIASTVSQTSNINTLGGVDPNGVKSKRALLSAMLSNP